MDTAPDPGLDPAVARMKERLHSAPYEICLARPRHFTASYRETEGLDPALRNAHALARVLERQRISPALTKSDALAGQVAGHPDALPPVWDKLKFQVTLMERVVGAMSELVIEPLKHHEPLMLSVGTAVTVGIVTNAKKDLVEVTLKRPVCAELGSRIAISRQVGARWRLIGMGVLVE